MSTSPLAQPEPWTLVADAYAAELEPQFALYARDALALAALPAGSRVVDVATGPGTLAMLAAGAGHSVSALDFSPAMVANFKARLAGPGAPSIDVRVGDGQSLPFADGTFDGAFSMFGLMFFPDRGAGFRELRRVLWPGGRAVVSSWGPFVGPFSVLFESLRALLPDVPFAGGKPPLGTAEEMAGEMKAAGFSDVAVHSVAHTLRAPTLAEFWGSAQRTNVQLVLLRRRIGEARWGEVVGGIYDRLRAQLGEGEVAAVGTALRRGGVGTRSAERLAVPTPEVADGVGELDVDPVAVDVERTREPIGDLARQDGRVVRSHLSHVLDHGERRRRERSRERHRLIGDQTGHHPLLWFAEPLREQRRQFGQQRPPRVRRRPG